MPSPITQKTLEHLAELARIELAAGEEEKLLADLQNILDYFEELKTLETGHVAPVAGGGNLKNVFRNDDERENTYQGKGTDAFPKSKNNFLKVPPVFE